MISLTVEKRYGTATVRARVATSSVEEALELYKDAQIVTPGEGTRLSNADHPGDAMRVSSGGLSAEMAA